MHYKANKELLTLEISAVCWFSYGCYGLHVFHRHQGSPRHQVEHLGTIGAGTIGAGIISAGIMGQGKRLQPKAIAKNLNQGGIDGHKMQQVLALIHPTDKTTDLKGCDLIIEAVFEDK